MASLVLGGLAASLHVPAMAQPGGPVPVSLEVDPCTGADSAEVRRVFELELGTSVPDNATGNGSGNGRGDAEASVTIGCEETLILLRVRDSVTGKELSRRIDVPPGAGRERLLALAATELLLASWIELEADAPRVAPSASGATSSVSPPMLVAGKGFRSSGDGKRSVMTSSRSCWVTTARKSAGRRLPLVG